MSLLTELKQLKEQGLTIADCIAAFGVAPEDSPFVAKAQEIKAKNEIDPCPPIMVDEEGAWVLTWTWISNEDAGIVSKSDLLTQMLDTARKGLAPRDGNLSLSPAEQRQHSRHSTYADWMAGVLVVHHGSALDMLERNVMATRTATPVTLLAEDKQQIVEFLPAQALSVLNSFALLGGLPMGRHLEVMNFISRNEAKLNTLLAPEAEPLRSVACA